MRSSCIDATTHIPEMTQREGDNCYTQHWANLFNKLPKAEAYWS